MSRVLGITLFSLGMALATASSSAQVGQTLALVGGTVYASPTTAPLKDAVVIVSGATISAVGSRSDVQVPQDARIIDCSGRSLTAGFWNSHVHFTEPVWRQAAGAPAEALRAAYRDEPLVEVLDTPEQVSIARTVGTPRAAVSVSTADSSFDPGRVVVVSSIDNLLKGAASQAVQNLNLMLGFAERTALEPAPGVSP